MNEEVPKFRGVNRIGHLFDNLDNDAPATDSPKTFSLLDSGISLEPNADDLRTPDAPSTRVNLTRNSIQMAVYTIIIAAVASGAVVWNWRSVEDAVRPWKQAFTRVDKEKDKAELQLQKSERARAQLEEERRELRRQVDSLHELIRVDRQARIRVDEETPQEVSPTERVPLKYQPSRQTDSFGELPK